MKKGFLNDSDWQPLSGAASEAAGIPMYIDDEGALSASAMRSRARRMVQRLGVRIIFVDYLQKMAAPKEYKGQREAEVNFNIQSLEKHCKGIENTCCGTFAAFAGC
jgi:replicative DNA helicase